MAALPSRGSRDKNSPIATLDSSFRVGELKRMTRETNVHVKLNLDASGVAKCRTGISFLDHKLDQLASHGLFDLHVKLYGDTHIDDHHTNAIGTEIETMHYSRHLEIEKESIDLDTFQLLLMKMQLKLYWIYLAVLT